MDALLSTGAIPVADTGYDVDNSLKFERANSEKLSRTPSSAGNLRTWTYSFWLKRTQLGINSYHLEAKGSGDRFFIFGFNENDQILFYDIYSDDYGKVFTRRFRDTSAWYHIVLRADTTNGTAGNRMRLYVNGVQETAVTSDYGDFPQNHDTQINKTVVHNIGYRTDINQYASGYMAETCLIDGTSLGPDSFGEFDSATGIWKPIDVTELTFGTNGFYQEYESSSALGADTVPGGNSNDYAASNIAAADQATDTPTNNFCTWNPLSEPLQRDSFGNVRTISEGGTKVTGSTAWGGVKGTIGVTNGKWYWENKASGNDTIIGWQTEHYTPDSGSNSHNVIDTVALYQDGGYIWIKDSTSGRNDTTASGTNASGQIMGFALDLDSSPQTATFYRNGSAIASNVNIDGATGKTLFPFMSQYNQTAETNFGGYTTYTISSAASDANGYGTFEYAPPSGYYALCTKNLEEYG